jgi:hypothetical protein
MPRSWRRLSGALEDSGDATIEMSFDAVSALVDVPKSDMKKPGFWKNDREKGHARAWLDVGYRVDEVDAETQTVRFKRD